MRGIRDNSTVQGENEFLTKFSTKKAAGRAVKQVFFRMPAGLRSSRQAREIFPHIFGGMWITQGFNQLLGIFLPAFRCTFVFPGCG
jgi:hypothetical protein